MDSKLVGINHMKLFNAIIYNSQEVETVYIYNFYKKNQPQTWPSELSYFWKQWVWKNGHFLETVKSCFVQKNFWDYSHITKSVKTICTLIF